MDIANAPEQTGIMIALAPPTAVAEALALNTPTAVSADQLHVTLAYIGDIADVPANKQGTLLADLLNAAQAIADYQLPLTAKVNGHGLFENGDDRAFWAAVDSPDLMELYFNVTAHLYAYGVEYSRKHSFTPHMTLAYLAEEEEQPTAVPHLEMTFDHIVVAFAGTWHRVYPRSVKNKQAETVVTQGSAVKAIDDDGRVGGYLVRFTDETEPDLAGDFFDAKTDFGPHRQSIVLYHHGLDEALGIKSLGGHDLTAELRIDDVGVWIEAQLDLRDEYENAIYHRMVKTGKAGWSSGTAHHLVKRTLVSGKAYHIDTWPLGLDASITPQPAAGPKLTAVVPLKTFAQQMNVPSLKAVLQEEAGNASADATEGDVDEPVAEEAEAEPTPETSPAQPESETTAPENESQSPADTADPENEEENPEMDPEALKTLLTETVNAAVSPLRDELTTLKTNVGELMTQPDNDPGPALPPAPGTSAGATKTAPHVLRFTEPDAALKQVQLEAAGGDFYALNHEQGQAFVKAMRDPIQLSREEQRLLQRQVFAPTHLKMLMNEGVTVAAIKELQQVAQGTLGGYAMPALMQEGIVTALPGRTAFRGNGATVITMTGESNTYPVTLYKNVDGQYVGTMRGGFSSEKGDPVEANYQVENEDIRLETYLFKIRKTTRELAILNLQQVLQRDILNTMAMDEDRVFAVGDGLGKPLGVLPGGTNSLGFKEVPSGHASQLTTAGIKKLKRGLASQYRSRGVFIGNSDTYSEVELLTVSGTGSDFAFPSLSENDVLLRRPALESGFMPDVAANSYPLSYVAPEGYYIVEVPGMTVARLQDTSTSVNKVEIHVMKMFGGRPVEPWSFAVQKVAAS